MKKIILGLVLVTAGYAVNAQSFNIGMGGGIFSTWLINKNVSDNPGNSLDYAVPFGGQIGLNATYYFNDKMGIGFGLLYTGHNQKYVGEFYAGNTLLSSYEAKVKLRYLDIPFLLRFGGGGDGGAFFEMGPQFGILLGAKEQFVSTPVDVVSDYKDRDVKASFKGLNIAGIIGFGVDIEASDNIIVTTGLRLGYGTNVTEKFSEPEAEALAEIDQLSFAWVGGAIDDHNNFHYKATTRAFAGFYFAVSYKIPTGASKGAPVPETK